MKREQASKVENHQEVKMRAEKLPDVSVHLRSLVSIPKGSADFLNEAFPVSNPLDS